LAQGIQATCEAEIGRIVVPGKPREKFMKLYFNGNTKQNKTKLGVVVPVYHPSNRITAQASVGKN
jgi:hypothetical protein